MATTFHKFSRLPGEIRVMIWRFAFEPDNAPVLSFFNFDLSQKHVGVRPNLTLQSVNKEAHDVVTGILQDLGYARRDADIENMFQNGKPPHGDQASRRNGKVFSRPWDPAQDAFFMDSKFWNLTFSMINSLDEIPPVRQERTGRKSVLTANGLKHHLAKVQNFATLGCDALDAIDLFLRVLSYMPDLKRVYLMYGPPLPIQTQDHSYDWCHARYALEEIPLGSMAYLGTWNEAKGVHVYEMGDADDWVREMYDVLAITQMEPCLFDPETGAFNAKLVATRPVGMEMPREGIVYLCSDDDEEEEEEEEEEEDDEDTVDEKHMRWKTRRTFYDRYNRYNEEDDDDEEEESG